MAMNKIYIYGEISPVGCNSSDFIDALNAVDGDVEVHINSLGGDVAEGIAMYNALFDRANNGDEVTTVCDGFACSIASVIFMAGANRYMNSASLLMIHNCWTTSTGDASSLREAADSLDAVNTLAKNAYKKSGLSDEDITDLMNAESWLVPSEALADGFATEIIEEKEKDAVAQSAFESVYKMLKKSLDDEDDKEKQEEDKTEDDDKSQSDPDKKPDSPDESGDDSEQSDDESDGDSPDEDHDDKKSDDDQDDEDTSEDPDEEKKKKIINAFIECFCK